jgi:hypothetical protein
MPLALHEVCCARVTPEALAELADLRCTSGIEVVQDDAGVWLRWLPGDEEVLLQLLPVAGAIFFYQREGNWYRLGSRLPSAGPPPTGEVRKLDRLVVPEPICSESPPARELHRRPVQLVRDTMPRQATALRTTLAALGDWAEQATTLQIAALRAARCGTSVLLFGARLPILPGVRYWGSRLLVPLGYRPEPALPVSIFAEAMKLDGEALAILEEDGCEIIPAAAFRPLSRAAIRLAVGDRP